MKSFKGILEKSNIYLFNVFKIPFFCYYCFINKKGVFYLPFRQNILQMQRICTNVANQPIYSNSFVPSPDQLPNLELLYPGRIPNKGDYRLELNGQALSHTDIVRAVHNCTLNGNGQDITGFLVDIYQNGLNANSDFDFNITVSGNDLSMNEFKQLIYWLILQEDINYPRPRFMGVRMPLTRYIEGVVAAEHPQLLSLEQVLTRTNNHGGPPPTAFLHVALHPYLINGFNQIQ